VLLLHEQRDVGALKRINRLFDVAHREEASGRCVGAGAAEKIGKQLLNDDPLSR